MSRVVVVIPTYNEVENLGHLIPRVLEQDPRIEILVVDDNSPDGTGKLAAGLAETEPRVHVLHRERKEGLGPAYRAGLRQALDLGADVVVQMDADFSHPPETLLTMLAEIEDCDVVLGSRYLKGITVVNWPIERILISYCANAYAKFVTRLPISDITGGFRCVRRSLLESIGFDRIRSDGYAFQIELNYRFWKHDARIREIQFFFLDRERGTSKLSLRIAVEAFWIVWWLRLANWFGRL